MMTLKEASRLGDTVTFTDAHGSSTFQGQVLLFNDTVSSGPSAKRRVLDVAPEVVIPVSNTVTDGAVKYLVGSPSYDYWKGSKIRAKYTISPVTTATLTNIGQILAAGSGTTAYVDITYLKRVILEDQSDFEIGYDMYFSSYFSISKGDITISDGEYYRARQGHRVDEAGFHAVELVRLDSPLAQMDFQAKGTNYDSDTDTYTPPSVVSDVDVFVESAFLDFVHEALGFMKVEPGDRAISFLKATVAAVKAGDKLGAYSVLSVSDNSTFWTIHGRK